MERRHRSIEFIALLEDPDSCPWSPFPWMKSLACRPLPIPHRILPPLAGRESTEMVKFFRMALARIQKQAYTAGEINMAEYAVGFGFDSTRGKVRAISATGHPRSAISGVPSAHSSRMQARSSCVKTVGSPVQYRRTGYISAKRRHSEQSIESL